jgi:NHL repeat
VAGSGGCSDCSFPPASSDGGPATSAALSGPNRVAADSAGNLYITEPLYGRVRMVSTGGIISTVAGSSGLGSFGQSCTAGSGSNGKPATQAALCLPYGIAVDSTDNLFIGEYGYRCCYDTDDPVIENFAVRQIAPDGIIGTVAGSATPGISVCNCADVGSGSVAIDASRNLYISDSVLIEKISADGSIAAIADGSFCCFSGDGGPAAAAQLDAPSAVAADSAGNVFIADTGNNRIRKVLPGGIIATVAGNGSSGYSGDGGPAMNAQLNEVTGVATDATGNLFIADFRNYRVRKISADGTITTVAGGGAEFGDGGPATGAIVSPYSVAVDSAGNLFIADPVSSRVRRVSAEGIITTVAGGGPCCSPGDGGLAINASLSPTSVAVDDTGNLFIVDHLRVRKVSPEGIITTVVGGDGLYGYSGDGGPASAARLSSPYAVTLDSDGNLFIADGTRIRKVSPGGIITTIAGNGQYGYTGDRGLATQAQLSPSTTLAVDGAGGVYLAQPAMNAIRVLQPEIKRR